MNNSNEKTVPGFPGYRVLENGTILDANRKAVSVYKGVVFLTEGDFRTTRSVARIVWEAWKGTPTPKRISHIDGDRANNHPDNLRRFERNDDYTYVMGARFEDLPGEVWKPITAFPGYEVSNMGRVASYLAQYTGKHTKDRRLHAGASNDYGYRMVLLRKDGKSYARRVHRLVLETFVGPKPFEGAQTRHLDGDPRNNTLENLKWGTAQENADDRVRHGRKPGPKPGESHFAAIHTDAEVEAYKERLAAGESYIDIAAEGKIARANLYAIGAAKSWKHIRPDLDCSPGMRTKAIVPDSIVEDIKAGASVSAVAAKYGVSISGVTRKFKALTGMNPRDWKAANKVGASA